MKIKLFYKKETPNLDLLKSLGKSLEDERYEVEYYDTDEVEGISQAKLYDVMITPSIIVTRDDGSLVQIWQGQIPLSSDVKLFIGVS